jgi:hypothetical protein
VSSRAYHGGRHRDDSTEAVLYRRCQGGQDVCEVEGTLSALLPGAKSTLFVKEKKGQINRAGLVHAFSACYASQGVEIYESKLASSKAIGVVVSDHSLKRLRPSDWEPHILFLVLLHYWAGPTR